MQVFNTFFKITKKQLPSFIIYFSIFTVLLGVMASMGTDNNVYKESSMDIAIFNSDNSSKSKFLEEYLSSKHNIIELENDDEVIQDALYFQLVDYVLYIDEGFKLTNIKRPGSTTGNYVDGHISTFEKAYDSYILAGYSEDEAYEKTIISLENEGLVSLKGKSTEKPVIYYFYTYFSYILIALLINILAPVIIALNRKEVRERTGISPLSEKNRSIQIITGAVILSVGLWVILNVVSVVMFKGELFQEKNAFYLLNSFCYLILSVGVVSILANFSLKPQALSMASTVVSLSFSFLGGVFVPMEIFGDTMMKIAKCVPSYWYMTVNNEIFKGVISDEMYIGMGIQLLFALAFFAVSLVVSKRMKLSRVS